jgi:hypothetical protein
MTKYAILDFDLTDNDDQYAIFYNDYPDGSGDFDSAWFDTEEKRAVRVEKDINEGIIFFNNWRKENA